jgi:hypothetical protein
MSLSQVSSRLSDPIAMVLGVLLPHLAGTVAEKASWPGRGCASGPGPGLSRCPARRADGSRSGCTAAISGGWPTRRSAAGRC